MLRGTVLSDRFEVREAAGSGGMATVYRAIDRATGAAVAIKVLSSASPSEVLRLEREARVLERLVHPHIVGFVAFGTLADSRPFVAIDWLDGETLASRLERVVLSIAETLTLVADVARALAFAHERGVVHRDIKPSNIFLLGAGLDQPRVLDFGVARVLDGAQSVTRTGTALGTPAYMAPEQARGSRDVDARADLYALGCVIYDCLAGRPPFQGDDVMAVLAKVLFDEPPRLSTLAPAVPDALDDLCARLLDKDPARRPASASDVAHQLVRIAEEAEGAQASARLPSARPPRPLTANERRLVAVVAVAPESDGEGDGDGARTLASDAVVPVFDLAREAARFDARFAPLANGSCIAVLEGDDAATDLALRGARCALAFRAACPGLPVAFVMGRAVGGRVPVGDVIDRVARTLRASRTSNAPLALRIDELSASLLEARCDLVHDASGVVLRGERERPRAGRMLLGRESPFVGRSRELRMLEALYDECQGDSIACVSVVTGAAGVGKSRLVDEWLAQRAKLAGASIWLGRGDPITAGSPLGLVEAVLRSAAGISRGEPRASAQAKLHACVAGAVTPTTAPRVTAFLGELLGIPADEASVELCAARSDPTLMGDQMRRAFEDFTRAMAQRAPLVMCFEDAQWGDAASFRFVDAALRHSKDLPLFVVLVGRSELSKTIHSVLSLRSALHLSVGELPRRACEQFVDSVLGEAADPALRGRIVEQASGNAFFLEELVRFAAEGRGAEMPATVIAMLQARLQALPSAARRCLRAASVLGNSFWLDAVTHLAAESSASVSVGASATASSAGAALRDAIGFLAAEELVEGVATSRFPGQAEYRFRQGLVRDAAYEMLTPRDRAAGHRLAAEWLEAAGERDPVALAEHLLRSGAGPRAAAWFSTAAAQALEGHDFTAALSLVERARSAAGAAGGERSASIEQLLLIEAEALRWKGELTAAEARASSALERSTAGSLDWFTAAAQLAALSGVSGGFHLLTALAERIRTAPCDGAAKPVRLLALSAVGRRLFQMGDYATAREILATLQAECAAQAGALEPRAEAELARLMGASARHVGNVAGDRDGYERALRAFERAGDVRGGCNARVSLGFSYIQLGAHQAARTELERAIAEARRLGLPNVETRAHQNLSLVLHAEGRSAEAIALATRVVLEAKGRGDERFEAWTRLYLARFALAVGDFSRASEEAALASTVLSGTPPAFAGALATRALALVGCGELEQADKSAREAQAIIGRYDGIEEFESLVSLASIVAARALGEIERARSLAISARRRLLARAASISEEPLRQSFLEHVTENAAIVAESNALEAGTDTSRVAAAYSGDAFRLEARSVVERLGAHLHAATHQKAPVVRGQRPADELLVDVPGAFADEPIMTSEAFVELLLERSPAQHHPRYVGHQVSPALPRAAAFALVGAVLNNGMAALESGPIATMMERRVVDFLLGLVGWNERGGGVLTSGGSLGNLTALLAARQAKAGFDVRERGLAGEQPLSLLASAQVHYSIERAAQIMGLGREAVIAVPTDEQFRVDPRGIEAAVRRAHAAGRRPIAMVASAGATGTGSVDPLAAVADACEALDLWLHIDGAHGASGLLSQRHRAALSGIERADSLVWDAHKLMNMPALATAVLWKSGRAAYATFAQDAAYLFRGDDERWFDIGLRTIECTKPLIAVPLYGCLATMGTSVFRDSVDAVYGLARAFAAMLREAPDFELACEPDTNIVCFRHLAAGGDDARQRRVIDALRSAGSFYLVQTVLRGQVHLRTSLMNPLTTVADLAALLAAIRAVP